MSRGQLSKELIDVGAQRQRLSVEKFAALRASIIEAARPAFSARCPSSPRGVCQEPRGWMTTPSLSGASRSIARRPRGGRRVRRDSRGGARDRRLPHVVADGSSYLLDEYRGHGVISIFFYRELVALWLRNLLRRRMFLFVVCSPAAYKVISKYAMNALPQGPHRIVARDAGGLRALKARAGLCERSRADHSSS